MLFALLVAASALPAAALAAPHGRRHASRLGTIAQLRGKQGCLVDRSRPARQLRQSARPEGGGPVHGLAGDRGQPRRPERLRRLLARATRSRSSRRNPRTAALTQPNRAAAGCVAAKGADGCAPAIGLDGPNSVAVSPDGKQRLRDLARRQLDHQLPPQPQDRRPDASCRRAAGCISGLPIPGCAGGRALLGARRRGGQPRRQQRLRRLLLRQRRRGLRPRPRIQRRPDPGPAAPAAASPNRRPSGCAPGIALGAPEGMAISRDGASVYVASALSSALAVLAPRPVDSGALTQAGDGSGCIVDSALSRLRHRRRADRRQRGRHQPRQRRRLRHLAVQQQRHRPSAGDRERRDWRRRQGPPAASSGCARSAARFGRAHGRARGACGLPGRRQRLRRRLPHRRDRRASTASAKPARLPRSRARPGCLAPQARSRAAPAARALRGVSSIALSPDGRFLYSTSFGSNAVDVFRRNR